MSGKDKKLQLFLDQFDGNTCMMDVQEFKDLFDIRGSTPKKEIMNIEKKMLELSKNLNLICSANISLGKIVFTYVDNEVKHQ